MFSTSGSDAVLNIIHNSPFTIALILSAYTGASLEAFCLCIRHAAPAISISVLGPRVSPSSKARRLELGCDDYIEKPFDDDELLARLESAVRRAQRNCFHNDYR